MDWTSKSHHSSIKYLHSTLPTDFSSSSFRFCQVYKQRQFELFHTWQLFYKRHQESASLFCLFSATPHPSSHRCTISQNVLISSARKVHHLCGTFLGVKYTDANLYTSLSLELVFTAKQERNTANFLKVCRCQFHYHSEGFI